MLSTLLESNAARTRRVGGTLASTIVHGAIIAGAVALTVPPAVRATAAPKDTVITYVIPQAERKRVQRIDPIDQARTEMPREPISVPLQPIDPKLPSIDAPEISAPRVLTGSEVGPGLPPAGPIGSESGLVGPPNGIVDEHLVDRAPRLIGRVEPPIFPAALRASGRNGRVVVQFVVDTLGRAEMSDFRVVEADDALFGEAVRAALPRYRFSPGEAGGRKVRTLVQLPFDFTLLR